MLNPPPESVPVDEIRRKPAITARGKPMARGQAAPVTATRDNYRDAGVDTDAADEGLARLTRRIAATWPPAGAPGAVKLPIGYFANVVDVAGHGIAITTDGVGSKTMIAAMLGRYDTVGSDCVAVNVNDVVCVGATPVSLVDYIAVDKADAAMLDAISVGLCRGAELAGVSISGGETAQLPDMVTGFDLAGTAIGHVALDRIIMGADVRAGDAVIGIASNGVHSNGFSLVRHTFLKRHKYPLSHRFDDLGATLGDELLRSTHIYVKEALDLIAAVPVKALAHITSDGFLNLTRVKADVGYVLDALPDAPPIFSLIKRLGEVDDGNMFDVFNMGVGFCAVVADKDAARAVAILSSHGKRAWRIGHAVADPARRVILPQHGLVGQGKHFRRG
jgi:phosphoribosylformylglycinamidine cyclo-ligase